MRSVLILTATLIATCLAAGMAPSSAKAAPGMAVTAPYATQGIVETVGWRRRYYRCNGVWTTADKKLTRELVVARGYAFGIPTLWKRLGKTL